MTVGISGYVELDTMNMDTVSKEGGEGWISLMRLISVSRAYYSKVS